MRENVAIMLTKMARPQKVTPQPQRRQLLAATRKYDTSRAALIQAVKDAAEAGGGIADIAEVTGRSTNTIQRWLKE